MSLFSGLRSLFRRTSADASPPLPAGLRIYAFGDIHGFADLFGRLVREVERDLIARPVPRAEAVMLGDYVDRGPDSAAVLDRLARADCPLPFVALRGNHEVLMSDALAAPEHVARWLDSGGDATLRSYRVDPPRRATSKEAERARTALLERIPAPHRGFLDATRLHYRVGAYTFVHAGLRPGIPLERQSVEDLTTIRGDFFRAETQLEGVVVHGHTPRRRPENAPHRINVDTGVFKYGTLTCAVLEGAGRRFLSVRR